MHKRVRNVLAALAVTGVIAGGGAAIANAASGSTSTNHHDARSDHDHPDDAVDGNRDERQLSQHVTPTRSAAAPSTSGSRGRGPFEGSRKPRADADTLAGRVAASLPPDPLRGRPRSAALPMRPSSKSAPARRRQDLRRPAAGYIYSCGIGARRRRRVRRRALDPRLTFDPSAKTSGAGRRLLAGPQAHDHRCGRRAPHHDERPALASDRRLPDRLRRPGLSLRPEPELDPRAGRSTSSSR